MLYVLIGHAIIRWQYIVIKFSYWICAKISSNIMSTDDLNTDHLYIYCMHKSTDSGWYYICIICYPWSAHLWYLLRVRKNISLQQSYHIKHKNNMVFVLIIWVCYINFFCRIYLYVTQKRKHICVYRIFFTQNLISRQILQFRKSTHKAIK